MNAAERAMKLADAAQAAVRDGDLDAIDGAFDEVKPTARDVARAYALCLTKAPYNQSEATRLILNTLQFALAERTAHRLNALNWWIAILTGVIVVFGVIDLVLRLRGM